MKNLLLNGRFYGNLNDWAGDGAFDRSLGYPRQGCVALDAGENISQEIGLSEDALYTLHFFYRLASGATLTVKYGATTLMQLTGTADVWHEGVTVFALDAGANDSIQFVASSAAAYVDACTLMYGGLAISRAEIAGRVHARLTALAADAGLGTSASSAGDQGSYSAAIDEALRAVGAMGRYGEPDVTELGLEHINAVIDATQSAILGQLQATYALATDVTLGPQRENRSQIISNISKLMGGGSNGDGGGRRGRVVSAKLSFSEWMR